MIDNYKIIHLKEVDSTNNYAQKLTEKSSNEDFCNTVVCADFQTNGRGAYKNHWESDATKNLICSIILCPNIEAKDQFIISKITSLSIISYLKQFNIDAEIKWPNDILVNKKKIAGILIENSIIGSKISDSIIGIGLNVNQLKFSEKLKATSVFLEKSTELFIKNELNIFLTYFDKWKYHCNNENYNYINSEYFKFLIGNQEFIKYRKSGKIFEAIITNIDEFGRLIVKTKAGEQKTFAFKEIEMIY